MANNYISKIPQTKKRFTDVEYSALKEVGIFVRSRARENLLGVVEEKTGNARRSINYRLVGKSKSVQIGLKHKSKGFYANFIEKGYRKVTAKGHYLNKVGQIVKKGTLKLTKVTGKGRRWRNEIVAEFGGKNVPAKPFLAPAAERYINEIRMITGKHFETINKENIAMGIFADMEGE